LEGGVNVNGTHNYGMTSLEEYLLRPTDMGASAGEVVNLLLDYGALSLCALRLCLEFGNDPREYVRPPPLRSLTKHFRGLKE